MVQKRVAIHNQSGLHARPASEFVECAESFESDILICRADEEEDEVNAKSMVLLLTLGLCQGDEAMLRAEGADEQKAVDTLAALIESGFGEL